MTDADDSFAYVDCETTGLDPRIHQAFELAYAIDDGPIIDVHLPHTLEYADPVALRLNGYHHRGFGPHSNEKHAAYRSQTGEVLRTPRRMMTSLGALRDLTGKTIVGCNPAFDQEFLRRAFGYQAWHYRLLDLEAWGAGVLGFDRPLGNKDLQRELRDRGFTIGESDHTAIQDVRALRQCHQALRQIQKNERALTGG